MIFVIVDYVIKYPYFVSILSRYPIENPAGPAPDFLKFRGNTFSKTFSLVRKTVNQSRIATVCEEALEDLFWTFARTHVWDSV